jgi:hypothetical protein
VPVQSRIENKTVTAGTILAFNVSATDADNDTITYGTNATNGTLNTTTGEYSWLTNSSDAGTYVWYFNSSDPYGGVATQTITVTVIAALPIDYLPPSPVNLASTQGNFWINHTWQAGIVNVTDSFNVSVNGIWTNSTSNTYKNSTVPPHGWSNITVYAYNASGTGTLNTTPISNNTQVTNNVPVQAAIGTRLLNEGDLLSFSVSATDADGDAITNGTNASKGTLNPTTGNFTWQTTFGDSGTYVWNFNSTDSYGGIASETITVTVNNVPLSITSSLPATDPATNQEAAQAFNITLNRTANVTWYMNGTLVQTYPGVTSASYTNSTAAAGVYNVTSTASDGIDTVSRTWIWKVNTPLPLNFIPPSPVNLASTQGNFWINHTWQAGIVNVTDSFNVSVNGIWTNSTSNTYKNSTVPPHGWSNITVYAYNASGTGTLNTTPISNNTQVTNNVPAQSPLTDKTITSGSLLTFNVNATDLDLDPIIYGTNATNGTLNPTTGDYSWLTTSSDVGTYVWYFNSTDPFAGVATQTITVNIISKTITLVANSTGNTGFSALTIGENFFSNNISNAQVGGRTQLTTTNRNALSVDDTTFVNRTGSNSQDAIMVVNFTLSNVTSVNWVSLKFVGAVTTTREPLIIGLYNATSPSGGGWTRLNSTLPPAINNYITMTYNVTSQADKNRYLMLNGNTLNFSFAEWVNGTANAGLSNDLYEATINYN